VTGTTACDNRTLHFDDLNLTAILMSCCLLYCYKDAILCNMTTRYTIPPSQEKAIKVPARNPFLSAPKLALTSYPSPDPVKHERQRYHQHRQPRQQPRCADRSQPVIHLVGKQRETCCEGRSQCRVAGHGARRDRSICAAAVNKRISNQNRRSSSVSFREKSFRPRKLTRRDT
jgi:hypothetical protein